MKRALFSAIASSLALLAILPACGDDDGGHAMPADASADVSAPDAGTPLPLDGGVDSGRSATGPIDRAGRFLVIRTLVAEQKRDAYNAARTFADHSGSSWAPDVSSRLERFDELDESADWSSPHALASVFLTDALLVDTGKASCTESPVDCPSYLDLETAAVGANATFGGRPPNDDAADAMLTLLVEGSGKYHAGCAADRSLCAVRDGVGPSAARRATNVFPYLAE